MKKIKIPKTVTSIGEGIFYGCNCLTEVQYSGTEKQWRKAVKKDVGIVDFNETQIINMKDHVEVFIYRDVKKNKAVIKLNDIVAKNFKYAVKRKKSMSLKVEDMNEKYLEIFIKKNMPKDMARLKRLTINNNIAEVTLGKKDLKKITDKKVKRIVIRKSGKNYKVAYIGKNGKSIKNVKTVVRIKSKSKKNVYVKGKKKKSKFSKGVVKFTLSNAEKFTIK